MKDYAPQDELKRIKRQRKKTDSLAWIIALFGLSLVIWWLLAGLAG